MNSSSPPDTPVPAPEDRFARLLDMGFERVDAGPATTESIRIDHSTHKVTQVCGAMGSFVSITALHRSHALAEDAVGRAFETMDRLIGTFNRFDSGSPLSYLNDTGAISGAPPELVEVIERSLAFGRGSAGAFDVTVKPVIDLFRDPATYEPRTPPGTEELREALALVGAQHVELSKGRGAVRLQRSGMGLTLDGIAKGYIVDGIADTLRVQGVSRFLINAGGDIRTGGDRGDASPWSVAVRDPEATAPSWDSETWERNVVPETLHLSDVAVATSGSYEIYFDSERLSHHIVRTDSGRSPTEALSVTVIAPTTVEADALATSVFVLGARRGTRLIENTAACECLVIDRDGGQMRSSGWRRHVASERASARTSGTPQESHD